MRQRQMRCYPSNFPQTKRIRPLPPPAATPMRETSNFSPRIIGFAFFLIVLFIAFFLYKNGIFEGKEEQPAVLGNETRQQNLDVPIISLRDAFKAINSEDSLLIDIRSENAYNIRHIESSINIPAEQLTSMTSEINKNLSLIIIDEKQNYAGQKIVADLISQGYNAKFLEGGFAYYSAKGYAAVSHGDPESNVDMMKTTPISSIELKEKLLKGSVFYYLDTRPKDSSPSEYINGAVRIPLEEIEFRKNELPHGKLIIFDEDQIRSYKAAVRLFDINIFGAYYFSDSVETLRQVVNGNKK